MMTYDFDDYRKLKLGQHKRALLRARHARHHGEYHAFCLRMAALVRSTLVASHHALYPRDTYRTDVTSGRF